MQLRQLCSFGKFDPALSQVCCISSSKTKLFLFFQLSLRHFTNILLPTPFNFSKNEDDTILLLSILLLADREYFWYISCDVWLRDGWNRSHLKEAKKRKRKKAKNCKHQSHENVTSAKKSKFEIIGDNSSQNVRSWPSLYKAE